METLRITYIVGGQMFTTDVSLPAADSKRILAAIKTRHVNISEAELVPPFHYGAEAPDPSLVAPETDFTMDKRPRPIS